MSRILIAMGAAVTGLIWACVSLTVSLHALQAEVSKLQARVTAADAATAAAVQKFERDFFARQDAEARARQAGAQAAAQREAAEIKADVTSLATVEVHKTINWWEDKKQNE